MGMAPRVVAAAVTTVGVVRVATEVVATVGEAAATVVVTAEGVEHARRSDQASRWTQPQRASCALAANQS